MRKNYLPIFLFLGLLITTISIYKVFAQTSGSQNTTVVATSTDDHDLDGIPSSWELFYGFDHTDPSDANDDPDLDLLTNLEEYLYETDPLDPDTDGGTLIDGKEIQEGKDPLNPLDDLIYPQPDDGGKKRASPTPSLDKRADSDGDGLSNIREERFHTDPNKKDTDNDGIGDYDEIFTYFTDPLNWDSDADGLLDGEEVFKYYTNPLFADSDYDQLLDGQEVKIYGTSPTDYDTDNGGVPDGDEVIRNDTDPLNDADDINMEINLSINGLPASRFGTRDQNKINLITNMKFSVDVTPNNNSENYIKEIEIAFANETIKLTQPQSNVLLTTPKKADIYPLSIRFTTNKDEVIQITKFVNVEARGKVFGRIEGSFANFFKSLNIGEYGLLNKAQVSVEKYNEEVDKWSTYTSETLNTKNPIITENGEYGFLLEPGIYKISINKKNTIQNEVFVDANSYRIYSKNIYVTYNYDKYGWALLFIAIYHMVAGLYLIAVRSNNSLRLLTKLMQKRIKHV